MKRARYKQTVLNSLSTKSIDYLKACSCKELFLYEYFKTKSKNFTRPLKNQLDKFSKSCSP